MGTSIFTEDKCGKYMYIECALKFLKFYLLSRKGGKGLLKIYGTKLLTH